MRNTLGQIEILKELSCFFLYHILYSHIHAPLTITITSHSDLDENNKDDLLLATARLERVLVFRVNWHLINVLFESITMLC